MNRTMNLYFDNAATSWPKPDAVYDAPGLQMRQAAGNPGRSGHTRTLEADRLLYKTREALAELLNAPDPSRIVFALNATDALNIAIKGFLKPGDHVLFTAMEHNSVLRPLGRLRQDGIISTTMIPCSDLGLPNLAFLEGAYRNNTSLLIVNHASNVIGSVAPLAELIASAHARGVKVLVDAAQTAGLLPVNVQEQNIDLLAFTGHKGLLGPTGTGGLYVRQGIDLKPLREGGTGSQSESDIHPESMPERLEAGTLNSAGLAGLLEGIRFINARGIDSIRHEEQKIRSYLCEALEGLPGVNLHGPGVQDNNTVAVVSFTIDGADCGEIGHILESVYGILTRTGLHCAPHAHKAIGTFPEGTVRVSPGVFTGRSDVDYLIKALAEVTGFAVR